MANFCSIRVRPIIALALLLWPTLTSGLSTGAVHCDAGSASVGGQHFSGDVTTGPLSEATIGLKVLLDGNELSDSEPTDFVVGRDYALNIQGEGTFRGFLFRLGSGENGTDTTESLYVAPENEVVQVATSVCVNGEGVGGLTHKNNLDKTGVAGTLRMDETDKNMPLDVTVVIQNRDGVSIYHYSQFVLNAVESTDGSFEPKEEASSAFNGMLSILVALMLGIFSVTGL